MDSVIIDILGKDQVEVLKIKNVKSGEEKAVTADGVFIYAGKTPSTVLFEGFISLDANGYVITDAAMQTSRPGVFAAGDVRHTPLRQVVTADEYIEHLKGK